MKFIGIAMVFVLVGISHVAAAARDNAMDHIANAYALSAICTDYRVNDTILVAAAIVHDLDLTAGSADAEQIGRQAEAELRNIKGLARDEVCAVALVLYGPSGTATPGLLVGR